MRFRSPAAPQDSTIARRRGKGVRHNMRHARKTLTRKLREAERLADQ